MAFANRLEVLQNLASQRVCDLSAIQGWVATFRRQQFEVQRTGETIDAPVSRLMRDSAASNDPEPPNILATGPLALNRRGR